MAPTLYAHTASRWQLLEALELAQLGPTVSELAGGLDASVAEKGANFSAGQVTRLRRDCAEIAPRCAEKTPRWR